MSKIDELRDEIRDLEAENDRLEAHVSLLADSQEELTRWQALRKYILAIRNGDVPVTHTGGDYVTAVCNLILGEFHRLAPAPAEAQEQVVASVSDPTVRPHVTAESRDALSRIRSKVLPYVHTHADYGSEPDTVSLKMLAIAVLQICNEAGVKYTGPRQEVNPYLDYLFHKPECGCELCIQWHEDFPPEY